ncbi:MAG: STAS/SEC14 domain-containing protein [Bacteroidales bacterium]|nr:STAS/SEC14 domain-containing protein [Bacteroidales bacterium]
MSKAIFRHDEELKILRVKYPGMLTKEEIIAHYDELRANRNFHRNIRILIDCRDSTFMVKPEEVPELTEAAKKAVREYVFVKEAMMVTDPYETVIVILFEKGINIPNYRFKIFYTEEAALNWLL